jgi:exopolyphosphatase/pppGpp-phosphohydrolase
MPDYDPKLLEGFILSRSEVFRQISLYRSMSLDEIKAVVGMDASRADTILAGAMIILRMMDYPGCIKPESDYQRRTVRMPDQPEVN